jgi:hypothetical protein
MLLEITSYKYYKLVKKYYKLVREEPLLNSVLVSVQEWFEEEKNEI